MTDKDFHALKKSVERIETGIFGDEQAGIEGIVKRVNRHEKLLVNIQRIGWGILGASTLISIILGLLKIIK